VCAAIYLINVKFPCLSGLKVSMYEKGRRQPPFYKEKIRYALRTGMCMYLLLLLNTSRLTKPAAQIVQFSTANTT
jgi:hypothetical protein